MGRTIERQIKITPLRAGRLLSFVAFMEKNKNATIKDFGREIGMPASALPGLLTPLVEQGFLVKLRIGIYKPSSIFHEYVAELMEISSKETNKSYVINAMLTPKEVRLLDSTDEQQESEPVEQSSEAIIPESVQVDLKDDILSLTVGKVKINIHIGE